MSASDRSPEFHLAEYESLRKEMEAAILETRTLERYALVGTGGVWAWLATNSSHASKIAWAIPILFALFGGLRAWSMMRSVWRATRYVAKLEEYFAAEGVGGWEHYLKTADIRGYNFQLIAVFWLALAVITIAVAAVIGAGLVHIG